MNSFIYYLLIFLSISIKHGHSYSSGAPPIACGPMLPQHDVSSQACSSKYIIESNTLQYSTNDTVQITIRGSTISNTFRGILLIAKTKTNQQIIGTWSVLDSTIQTLSCGGIPNTGITHNSPVDKSSIHASWHPPSTITNDPIVIKATIVQSFNQIYVGCFSITLTAKSTNALTTVASGQDHVFVCKRSANDKISVVRGINPLGNSPTVLGGTTANLGGKLTPTLLALRNGVAYCEFNLSNFSASKRRRRAIAKLSQSQPYSTLIAIGNLDRFDRMIKHTSRAALPRIVRLNIATAIAYN
ncbi:unnamed protein product [Rotaria sp. Silwood2]|nr:unnamed protein product [Rotaria sp. Silwood2]CAF4192298.1 unnamed protein product [Rotaria sp. Silwood2]